MHEKRCVWCEGSELLRDYHDAEWGVPNHDDKVFFEHLLLESMSCGLSWLLMLKKRAAFARCFANFDYRKIAKFGETDVVRIMADPGVIRSEPKIRAAINNARRFIEVQEEFGSFDHYIWSFTGGKTVLYAAFPSRRLTRSALSDAVAKNLKKRGFKFVGSVSMFSLLEACGLINDHLPDCCRREPTLCLNETVTLLDEEASIELPATLRV